MRTRSNPLLKFAVAALAALSSASVEARGTFSLGRSLAELSASDREAMKRARIAVLETMQPGSVSAWNDVATGHSGEVELHRMYEKNGMTCGDVEYVLKIPDAKRFQTAFCRGGDGIWRLVG